MQMVSLASRYRLHKTARNLSLNHPQSWHSKHRDTQHSQSQDATKSLPSRLSTPRIRHVSWLPDVRGRGWPAISNQPNYIAVSSRKTTLNRRGLFCSTTSLIRTERSIWKGLGASTNRRTKVCNGLEKCLRRTCNDSTRCALRCKLWTTCNRKT